MRLSYGYTGYWASSFYFTLLTMTKGLATYLRLMALPHPLSLEYLFATSRSLGEPRVLLSCAIIAAPLDLAWKLRERRPILSLGILLFFAGLAPVLNIIPIKAVIAERFLYFSVIGFGLALGDAAAWAAAKSSIVCPRSAASEAACPACACPAASLASSPRVDSSRAVY